jgi:hypothetical protein
MMYRPYEPYRLDILGFEQKTGKFPLFLIEKEEPKSVSVAVGGSELYKAKLCTNCFPILKL